MQNPQIDIRELRTQFFTDDGVVTAVDGVSFAIPRGKTVGLVGESGCGKSLTGLSLLQLVPPPGRVTGGQVRYFREGAADPLDLAALDPRSDAMRAIRGNEIAMIFQEPMTSLNPVYTIGDQIAEAVILHQGLRRRPARERAIEMLDRVRIASPQQRVDEYPHQLSGGMRQRAMIAMALACEPALLIADEPTTALDVTIQVQIMALLKSIQRENKLGIILITHDLSIVAGLCHRIAVMYAGRIIETGKVHDIYKRPAHPYTQALLEAIPHLGQKRERLAAIPGQPPSLLDPPKGCRFAPRCPKRMSVCDDYPPASDLGDGHVVHCWLAAKQ
jgi:oligopeptide/dipeptide ABC transporter ATP-binding protein